MVNLDKVSKAKSRVFITGPSGSGKDTSARYIHENSKQSSGNFITINCSVFEGDELDRILFGFENKEGVQEVGALENANQGTIYLDEVSKMSLDLQGKILKFLVENTISRLGSSKKVDIECRVISSSNSDLIEQIKNKQFREDLFHRLNVVPIKVPSLSERIDDIPVLAKYFVKEFSSANGLPSREFTDEALSFLQGMNWPGNIRQFKNVIERVLILGDPSDKVSSDELIFTRPKVQDSDEKVNLISSELAGMSLREAREIFERDYLLLQINRFGGNISKTSAFVEMERSALHRKLKSLGINSGQKN
jgi:two-component system nitrogen regulation response regulator NtrX